MACNNMEYNLQFEIVTREFYMHGMATLLTVIWVVVSCIPIMYVHYADR